MAYKHFVSWPLDGERIYLSAVFCYNSTIVLLTYGKIFYSRGGDCLKLRNMYYETPQKDGASPLPKKENTMGNDRHGV